MPVFIPKPEEQATYFQDRLEPGEQIQAPFWCEQRLPLLMHMLIDRLPLGELIFSAMRHRYFVAVTDRRVLIMGSSGMHNPTREKFESLPRSQVACTQFTNWLGHIAMDLNVNGEVRRYRVPRSQQRVADHARTLSSATAGA
jgi:hypothetical protein